MMTPALVETLRLVAEHGAHMKGDWWIIGSSAAVVAGCNVFEPEDVDLFGSTECMNEFVRSFGQNAVSGSTHEKFKSMPFQRIAVTNGLPIEVMGGLEVNSDCEWKSLSIKSRIEISGFGAPLWIPSIKEQIAIFELFGRPKDVAKAKTLKHFSR